MREGYTVLIIFNAFKLLVLASALAKIGSPSIPHINHDVSLMSPVLRYVPLIMI